MAWNGDDIGLLRMPELPVTAFLAHLTLAVVLKPLDNHPHFWWHAVAFTSRFGVAAVHKTR